MLHADAQNGANAGLQRIAEVFAQHVTAYQDLGLFEIAQTEGMQTIWNNMAGTTQSRVERWEADQPGTQLLATLDGPVNSYTDSSGIHGKTYVYSVKKFSNGELIAVGYSKPVGL